MKITKVTTVTTVQRTHRYGNGVAYHDTAISGGKAHNEQWFTKRSSNRRYGYFPAVTANLLTIDHHCYRSKQHAQLWAAQTVKPETFTDFAHLWNYSVGLDGYLYNIMEDCPTHIWSPQDYIGGFTNDRFELRGLLKHLESFQVTDEAKAFRTGTRPILRKLRIEEIPYYNRDADSGHTLGIHFEYLLPQPLMRRLWRKYSRVEFPSCRIKDEIQAFGVSRLNLLGAAKFQKPKSD